jgi:hypothetical protein
MIVNLPVLKANTHNDRKYGIRSSYNPSTQGELYNVIPLSLPRRLNNRGTRVVNGKIW